MTLIPLAVELTKTADIQDLEFSQAFESIYTTLEALKNEEDGNTEVSLPAPAVKEKKRKRQRRVTCVICGQKFRSLAGKHLSCKHGVTFKEYKELMVQPGVIASNGNGAMVHEDV